jgi:hypothetical protein
MNFIDKIAAQFAFYYIRLGIMRLWSNIYAWLWERKTQAPLQRFEGLGELVSFIRTLKWRMDTWRELWDSVSSIGAIMWRALNRPDKAIGDCDEFGRLSACVIRNELRDNRAWGGGDIDTAFLLTVMWKKTGGQEWTSNKKGYGGHNVCLIRYTDGYWSYMDYGMPSTPRLEIAEVVKDVRDRYAQVYQPLGYAFHDPETLQLVGISRE